MSVLSDKRAICQEIAGSDQCLTPFEFEKDHYIAGPFGTLTPLCQIQFRKTDQEYRIDYDQLLTVWPDEDASIEALKLRIESMDFLVKHNVYPASFTLATITNDKCPSQALIERIRSFLLEHSKSRGDAYEFAQNGTTKFLKDCRRLMPSDYQEELLAKLA